MVRRPLTMDTKTEDSIEYDDEDQTPIVTEGTEGGEEGGEGGDGGEGGEGGEGIDGGEGGVGGEGGEGEDDAGDALLGTGSSPTANIIASAGMNLLPDKNLSFLSDELNKRQRCNAKAVEWLSMEGEHLGQFRSVRNK